MKILIGASGAGKSVLLKLILGLLRPDSGTILVNGYLVSDMSERELLRLRADVGMLFQDSALFAVDEIPVANSGTSTTPAGFSATFMTPSRWHEKSSSASPMLSRLN
jgi:ABC-type phosphate/phosphonate transport system ATPase subunit